MMFFLPLWAKGERQTFGKESHNITRYGGSGSSLNISVPKMLLGLEELEQQVAFYSLNADRHFRPHCYGILKASVD